MKIRPVAAEFLHANRRKDRHDEADSRCSQFFERAPKQASTTLVSIHDNDWATPAVFFLIKYTESETADSREYPPLTVDTVTSIT